MGINFGQVLVYDTSELMYITLSLWISIQAKQQRVRAYL